MSGRDANNVDAFVGARIALRRTAQCMSQAELGRKLGISFQQVQKYETGVNRVAASRLFAIAVALKTEPGAFFPSVEGERA